MSQLNKTSFGNLYGQPSGTTFPDNTTGEISENDVRQFGQDLKDSVLFISDHLLDEDDMASDSATKVPSQQSVKAYVDNQISGAAIQSVTKTLSTAEILSGNSSPVTILAGQGAGTIIHILSPIVWKWNYAGAAFATNTTSRMYINSVAPITNNNTVISLASVRYELLPLIDVDHTQAQFENTPITWAVSTGNPTGGGTSTLTIHFKYMVLTL